jgi:hypothetical protein
MLSTLRAVFGCQKGGCGRASSAATGTIEAVNDKIDFKKTLGSYHARSGQFSTVEVPPLQFLMIDGHGDPNTSAEYTDALQALYPVAYNLKFASKALGRDFTVMPLEGLWWADDPAAFTTARDKSQWSWTLMIMQPDWITEELFDAAVAKVGAKDAPRSLGALRLETLNEGRCVQTLHLGPFDAEGPTLARLHDEIIPARGLRMRGTHHEIYLSDLRRTAPSRLRTILRQPVEPL